MHPTGVLPGRRPGRVLLVTALLWAAAWLRAGPAGATHYPPGWRCYECHAVSASKLVPGTHLIKQSQKTFDLGITDTDPAIRCLFCHEAFRSAGSPDGIPRDRMKGVDEHFGATALSSHPVDVTKSTFTQDATTFDCLDCHNVTGVQADGSGNADVHGVDASQTLLAVNTTLVGSPADTSDAEISAKTCQSANCHDADGGSLNGYTAPPGHSASNTKLSLNDVPVASGGADADASGQIYCTKCHASHGSLDGEALLVLQNTSGHNGQAGTGATVRLDECDVCHVQDENGGLTDNFYAYGHGRMLACTGCHELRHDTDADGAFDPAPRLKANLAEGDAISTTFGSTTFYSNCRKCHAGHAPHTPSAGDPVTGRTAGCLDCHDPHGTAAADSTAQNDTMIRRTVAGEDTRLPDDDVKYNGGWYVDGQTDAVCDNAACHEAIPAGQSLNDDGAGGTNHAGGVLTATSCATGTGCHQTHLGATKEGTTFAAQACDVCHGYPPDTNAHAEHVDTAGFGCEKCHGAFGANHNESGIGNQTEFDSTMASSPGTIRNNVDLPFDAMNPNGSYSLAKGSRPDDTVTYGTCNTLYCHADDTTLFPAASQGTDTTPEWNAPATGACGTCHGATAASPPGSFAHPRHAGNALRNEYGIPCNTCHVTTTSDGTTVTGPAAHVNGQADVAFDTTDARLDGASAYGGTAAVGDAATDTGDSCSGTYCHSMGRDRAAPYNDPPVVNLQWDQTASCSSCHGFGPTNYADGALVDGQPKANKHAPHSWINGGCDTCHSEWYTAANLSTVHVNRVYDVGDDKTNDPSLDDFLYSYPGEVSTCDNIACHGGNATTWDYDVGTNGHFTCDTCHGMVGGVSTDTDVNDFTTGIQTSPQSKISVSEYNGVGHGAKGVACAGCHDSTVPHDRSADLSGGTGNKDNPFRLRDQDTGTAGTQFSCAYTGAGCHEAGTTGPATGLDISTIVTHSSAAMSGAGYTPKYPWSFAPECVNCHDPHGDGSNLSMVQRELYDKEPLLVTPPLGTPPSAAQPTEQVNLAFTDDTTGQSTAGTSFADSDTPFSSICQECHEGTPGTDTTYAFVDDTSASVSPHPGGSSNPGDCSGCHPHDRGFSPACTRCHGGGTAGPDAENYWPDGPNVAGDDTTANNSGAHEAHIAWLADYVYGYVDDPATTGTHEGIQALLTDDAQGTAAEKQKFLCEFCHAAVTNDDDHMVSYPADVFDTTVGGVAQHFARQYWNTGTAASPVFANDPDASYSPINRRCSNVDCHDTGGPGADWYVDPTTLACGSCHDVGTSHLKITAGGGNVGCPSCHPGGTTYPKRHSTNGSPNVVEIPPPPLEWDNPGTGTTENWNMQTRLGMHYKLHLGGEWTSGTTQAEICWNCHGTDDTVNEWGYNADTNGTSWPVVQIPDVNGATAGSYNYGWIYSDTGWTTLTPYWVNTGNPSQGMYRKDGYQHDAATSPSYALSRRISSVHSVDFTMGSNPGSSVANNVDASGNVIRDATQKLEPRSAIRCVYCHDVHDLNKAQNDTSSGRPYLRGSWMGNPYPPDMPPLAGYTYPVSGGPAAAPLSVGNRFSTDGPRGTGQFSEPVPRLWADPVSRNKGGYFIDANSGRPTDDAAYDTLAEAAGLCTLCHGTDVDNMDYYTGSSLWRTDQVNGHSNSTLGGTGANAVDLFDARRTTGSWLYMAHQDGVDVFEYGNQSGADSSGPFRASFRSFRPARAGGQYAPPRNTGWYGGTPGSTTKGVQYSTWYSAGGIGTDGVNPTAHKFPCSKCHSPHATGLPALLITNCLDKNVSDWNALSGAVTPSIQQANNCHRKEGTTTGWHRLAPAQ